MTDWLLVIDMQPGFGDPASPWAAPEFAQCQSRIAELLPRFGERVTFTRFVPPHTPAGAWVSYYRDWPFACDPDNAWLWDLVPVWRDRPSITGHRFAKWQEVRDHVPAEATLVICGVATDCCVLGTAIEAADDGRFVRLVTDACTAGTDDLHRAALDVMQDRAPMITLSTVAAEHAAQPT